MLLLHSVSLLFAFRRHRKERCRLKPYSRLFGSRAYCTSCWRFAPNTTVALLAADAPDPEADGCV
ncbi:hypothetical protein ACFX50_10810 [Neisseria meningitidis]